MRLCQNAGPLLSVNYLVDPLLHWRRGIQKILPQQKTRGGRSSPVWGIFLRDRKCFNFYPLVGNFFTGVILVGTGNVFDFPPNGGGAWQEDL